LRLLSRTPRSQGGRYVVAHISLRLDCIVLCNLQSSSARGNPPLNTGADSDFGLLLPNPIPPPRPVPQVVAGVRPGERLGLCKAPRELSDLQFPRPRARRGYPVGYRLRAERARVGFCGIVCSAGIARGASRKGLPFANETASPAPRAHPPGPGQARAGTKSPGNVALFRSDSHTQTVVGWRDSHHPTAYHLQMCVAFEARKRARKRPR
jgi:hypothetical protein